MRAISTLVTAAAFGLALLAVPFYAKTGPVAEDTSNPPLPRQRSGRTTCRPPQTYRGDTLA